MQIERNIIRDFVEWKDSPRRKPLLLNGVRQCGKTWALKHFGEEHFADAVDFNFDKDPGLASFFTGACDVRRIISQLSVYCGRKIVPRETLIIFDEIQTCPNALNSLKYFCEDAPEYAVAAAGSLIGLALTAKNKTGFPVGKVDIRELTPCSFDEYLRAVDPVMHEYVKTVPLEPLEEAFCGKLSAYLAEYLAVGGMPAVVTAFLETRDFRIVEQELDSVLQAYEADFSKHINAGDIPKLMRIWHSIPAQFAKENRRFMFGEVRQGARAKDLEDALQWLVGASMVQKVNAVDTPEYPLTAVMEQKTFKLYPSDVGVLRKLARISPEVIVNSLDIFSDFKGRLAENLVLEQFYALGMAPVCYWFNGQGKAEVDFLIQSGNRIVPVEVKSGLNVNAKSLKFYRERYNPQLSIRASMKNLRLERGLLNIPLYLLGELPRFLALAATEIL
ncbi:MAG: AAA family ATPase [Lentisphaeria bacterium]|nr:AAA family ATPase [Lentisphaeria bacterium]